MALFDRETDCAHPGDQSGSSETGNKPLTLKKIRIPVLVYKDGKPTGRKEILRRPSRLARLMRSMRRQPSEED